MKSLLLISLAILLLRNLPPLRAHDHMPAGATANTPGATLEYVPTADDFTTQSGWVFGLNFGTINDAYFGTYWTDDSVFVALAATPDNGGPEPGSAAPGTHIQVKLLSLEGPAGATFGFWEAAGHGTDSEGIDGTNLTWSVTVPLQNGTNLIEVSESDGSSGSDPYGHIHGRVYTFTKPGYYKATWQFVDTSTNGPGGKPVDLPSAPFSTQYQAGLTVDRATQTTNGLDILIAAPSLLADDAGPGTEPAQYTLQHSPALGAKADWQSVGDPVAGDDRMHVISFPWTGLVQFFRLTATYPTGQ